MKAAEALAESFHLNGVGLAKQRKEIAQGMKQSMIEYPNGDITPEIILDLLLYSQYYDTLNHIKSQNMFAIHSPSEVQILKEQVSTCWISKSDDGDQTVTGIPDLLW